MLRGLALGLDSFINDTSDTITFILIDGIHSQWQSSKHHLGLSVSSQEAYGDMFTKIVDSCARQVVIQDGVVGNILGLPFWLV